MATVDNYKINIEVAGGAALKAAQADMQGLEGTIGGLTGALNGLATAGFAALSALGASALKMADDMADLAAATGISVGAIYNLSNALEQSGGSFDGGSMMIGKFAKALDEAVGGSAKAQEAFAKLGISTQELATLTDEQLFQAAIDGLAGMEDGFAKTALATQLFGKEAKNIDFDALAEGTRNAVDPQMEAALLQAAQFVDDLAAAFRNMQVIAIQALGPVLEVVGAFIKDVNNLKTLVQILGALLAAAFAAKVVGMIIGVVNAIRTLAAATKAAGVAQAFLTALQGPKGLIQLAAAAAAAAGAYYALGKAMDSAGKAGPPVAAPKGGAGAGAPPPGTKLRDVQTAGGKTGGKSAAQSSAEATAEAMRRQTESARETTRQLILSNEEQNKMRQTEIDLIGISSDYANLVKSNAQVESNAKKDIAKLQADINEEQAKGTKANKDVIAELQKQIAEKQGQVDKTKELNQLEYDRTIQLGIQNNTLAQQKDLITLMAQKDTESLVANEKIALLRGKISEKELANKTRMIEADQSYYAKVKSLEADLTDAKKRKDEVAVDGINKQLETEKLRHDQTMANIKAEIEYEKKKQSSAAAGAKSAIESIREQFTEYNVAQMTVQSMWQNMTQAIDTFVDTGKFKFSDLARSILADMAKIALKAAASKILSGIFSAILGGGVPSSSSIGKLIPYGSSLKLAAGGPAKKDMPYTVGEQGPELFVPNSNGRIITNASLNKNATANMPQVQPVVNNTYITNNIRALDSKSVAQMFVENRKSLLGASTLARKELPY